MKTKKNSIKREQSHAGMNYAERKNFGRISGKAIIVAMAAITGTTIAQESRAMEIALHDMQAEGMDVTIADYTWDPFDGICA